MSTVLNDPRGTRTITIPGYEGSSVIIYDSILFRDAAKLDRVMKEQDNVDAVVDLFICMIQSWNFTDEGGTARPIDKENIGLLSVEGITYIAEQIREAIESKKNATKPPQG